METRFLETFLAVVQHGSLAEASRRMDVTPAAVAQRIQALEDEIGLPLLARSGRRVKPTEAGVAILEKSRRVLAEVRQLKGLARDDQAFGELRLSAISTVLTGLLPNALRRVFDRTPGVDIFLLPGTSAELYNSVAEEKIDAAILVKPPFPIPKTLNWDLIRSERFVLLAPRTFQRPPSIACFASNRSFDTTEATGVADWPIPTFKPSEFSLESGWSLIHLKPYR
ncbi:LysR family transcriptional regulator (plasmid) [Ensifer adhaerens]